MIRKVLPWSIRDDDNPFEPDTIQFWREDSWKDKDKIGFEGLHLSMACWSPSYGNLWTIDGLYPAFLLRRPTRLLQARFSHKRASTARMHNPAVGPMIYSKLYLNQILVLLILLLIDIFPSSPLSIQQTPWNDLRLANVPTNSGELVVVSGFTCSPPVYKTQPKRCIMLFRGQPASVLYDVSLFSFPGSQMSSYVHLGRGQRNSTIFS
ncbi:hypothetical protein FRC12_000562 [Ceratobasidium sp. 428]|nr:hypothetical protein FRC12_000562 [Ceratobasidium sp. 428]